MKKVFFVFALLLFSIVGYCQQKPYNESLDAVKQITDAVSQAKNENKYVLVQVGGNWCPWCLRFSEFAQTDTVIKGIIDKNYVYIHVNYSKKNPNKEAMKLLENPARFGFPVFVILDEQGKRIHTQNSAYLEEGKGYSEKKVAEFLNIWTPKAVKTFKD